MEFAKAQTDILASQLELSTAPLLVVKLGDKPGFSGTVVVNRGLGIAFQVFYWQGGLETRNQGYLGTFTIPSTLAPGASASLRIPTEWESWTIMYRGVDRQERWTVAYRDWNTKPQEHVVRKGLQEIYLA